MQHLFTPFVLYSKLKRTQEMVWQLKESLKYKYIKLFCHYYNVDKLLLYRYKRRRKTHVPDHVPFLLPPQQGAAFHYNNCLVGFCKLIKEPVKMSKISFPMEIGQYIFLCASQWLPSNWFVLAALSSASGWLSGIFLSSTMLLTHVGSECSRPAAEWFNWWSCKQWIVTIDIQTSVFY